MICFRIMSIRYIHNATFIASTTEHIPNDVSDGSKRIHRINITRFARHNAQMISRTKISDLNERFTIIGNFIMEQPRSDKKMDSCNTTLFY